MTEPEHLRKLFVGGLNPATTNDSLFEYFSKYGELTDTVVMKSNEGRSRGFGFVTYTSSQSVDQVINDKPHSLDGKEVDTKHVMPKKSVGSNSSGKSVYVAGFAQGTTKEELQEHFSKYGVVTSVFIPMAAQAMNKPYGFVNFEDASTVAKLLGMDKHELNGMNLVVNKAVSKQQSGFGGQGGRGGYSGGSGYGRGSNYGNGGSYNSGGEYAGYGGYGGSSGYPSGGYGNFGSGYGQPSSGGPMRSSGSGFGGRSAPYYGGYNSGGNYNSGDGNYSSGSGGYGGGYGGNSGGGFY